MYDGIQMIQEAIDQMPASALLDDIYWDAVRDGWVRALATDPHCPPAWVRLYAKRRMFQRVASFQPSRESPDPPAGDARP